MQIEIIFDAACPWCYIGKRRLERALASRPHVRAAPTWRPFLLNPELPLNGIDRTTYLLKKFGSEARIRRMYGALAEAGQSVEIEFAFGEIRRMPNTVDAHRLVRLAEAEGKADAVVEGLFGAYFEDGRDIGDVAVLAGIADAAGLDGDAAARALAGEAGIALVYEENAHAHHLGINGVPSFVFNRQMTISGAQEPQVLARMLDVALVTDRAA